MKIDKSLIAGSTTLIILGLLSTGDMYGYQMIDELEKRSRNVFTLKAGTLYPLLHSLEQKGMIESYEVDTPDARPRKYYRLTKRGKKLYTEKKSEWELYSSTVHQLLGGISNVCVEL